MFGHIEQHSSTFQLYLLRKLQFFDREDEFNIKDYCIPFIKIRFTWILVQLNNYLGFLLLLVPLKGV